MTTYSYLKEHRLNDDGRLPNRYYNKRTNAAKEGLQFLLTPQEYTELMEGASVVSSQLTITGYHLSRYGDLGDYVVGNCRFVYYKDNYAEKVVSEKSRAASRKNAHKGIAALRTPEVRARSSAALKEYWLRKRPEVEYRRAERRKLLCASFLDARNSQFGSYWITNGAVNQKWRESLGDLPEGFSKGRKV